MLFSRRYCPNGRFSRTGSFNTQSSRRTKVGSSKFLIFQRVLTGLIQLSKRGSAHPLFSFHNLLKLKFGSAFWRERLLVYSPLLFSGGWRSRGIALFYPSSPAGAGCTCSPHKERGICIFLGPFAFIFQTNLSVAAPLIRLKVARVETCKSWAPNGVRQSEGAISHEPIRISLS